MSGIPLAYRLFFIYVEPVSALAGASYAFFRPAQYLDDLRWKNPTPLLAPQHTSVNMSLYQLANLYLLFALNEHLVLSATPSLKIWKRLLFGLLVADFGHLMTIIPAGWDVFWGVREWNAMMWGSIAFVYMGATMRMCFLSGVGLQNAKRGKRHKGE